jgi:arginine decarboxylase
MNPHSAPLYEKMMIHHFQNYASFHVPGHKNGQGLDPKAQDFFKRIMEMDYTELPGLDDLHHPEGAIKDAQRLAAACFGAEETYFLVNGSTVGNLAMILSLCSRNDLLIVQRSVHKSVIHGLMLAGARAVFLPDRWDPESGLAVGVCREDVVYAMKRYPSAKGIFLSNPNYYGMGIELSDIANDVHAMGMVLLVDEAHGAHFGFHPRVPRHAMSSGADAVVQSTHKMLTAMTMGAMLHLQGDRIDRSLVRQSLMMLQTSSPSYPIMATLDLSRRWMHLNGHDHLEKGLMVIDEFQEKLRSLKESVPFVQLKQPSPDTVYETLDPFKITFRDGTGTFNGFQLKKMLEQAGCFSEMADPNHVLLHCTLATDTADMNRLFSALMGISGLIPSSERGFSSDNLNRLNFNIPSFTEISPPVSMELPQNDPRPKWKQVSFKEAVGRRAAEMVVPYPPGIPILYCGEMITSETAEYLSQLVIMGANFHGDAEGGIKGIKIF